MSVERHHCAVALVLGSQKAKKPGAHFTRRLRPIAIWSGFVNCSQIYSASCGDVPFFLQLQAIFFLLQWIINLYLRVQNSTKCHFNQPGKTRRPTVKGMLALFCYILTSGLFQFCMVHSATHPILSMLLTHSTSEPPVVTEVKICSHVSQGNLRLHHRFLKSVKNFGHDLQMYFNTGTPFRPSCATQFSQRMTRIAYILQRATQSIQVS